MKSHLSGREGRWGRAAAGIAARVGESAGGTVVETLLSR
jgi:hypothetical protein